MTGIEVIILIASILVVSAGIGYYMNYGQPTLKSMEEDPKKDIIKYPAPVSLTQSAKELVNEIDRVSDVPTTQQQSQQLVKDLVDTATAPTKKKRKHYPKKKQ